MSRRHYFVEDEYYGFTDNAHMSRGSSDIPCQAYGEIFNCALCGRNWASFPVDNEPFSSSTYICTRHKRGDQVGSWSHGLVWSWDIPGSIWKPWDRFWNRDLPKKLLEREFMLAYDLDGDLCHPEYDAQAAYLRTEPRLTTSQG